MNTKYIKLSRFNKSLLSVLLVSLLLYFGKSFLIPVAIAALFAMLLFPTMQWLQKHKLRPPLAAIVSILMLLAALVVLGTLVYYQLTSLESDLPRLEERIEERTNRLQWLLYETTDIPQYEQDEIIKEKKPDILKAVFKSLRDFLVQGLFVLLFTFIVLTYTFFFMMYQQRIQNFLVRLRLFESPRDAKVMFSKITGVIHNYLKGILTVIAVLAVLYALGFWAIGIEHAILFAIVTALLRIIPYFGSFLGIAFPIAFAFLTKDSLWYPVMLLIFFMVTQLLEANLLTPYITGSRVKLNPLATIMVILLGNLIWGVPGMILFVPMLACLKVIFDSVPRLNSYSYILGNDEDPPSP